MPLLATQWRAVRGVFSEVDYTFLALRTLSLIGGVILLATVPLPAPERKVLFWALAAFTLYSTVCYLVIFFRPGSMRRVYLTSLFLDLLFLSSLVHSQSYLSDSLFIGYYLLVCLHTIYFGLRFGLLVAILAASLLILELTLKPQPGDGAESALRLAFLFLLALPVGLLSEKVRREKQTVEALNTELEHSLANLRATQSRLVEAEKFSALGRLTAYIAHEIRNPLTAAGGFARRLEKKLTPGSAEKNYATLLVKEVDRLEQILRDTLIFGRAGEMSLSRADLNGPVRAAIELYRDLCREQNIVLRQDLAPELPPAIIDTAQVQQALASLITNSIHAMAAGGELTIRTDRREREHATYLTVEVSDSGPGINSEILAYIFEPFYSTKKIGVGTGLGLPIVKKIMDEHAGTVEVSSAQGQGTTITLLFPWQDEEQDRMTPCWEYLHCGIENDPTRRCRAYPHFGRLCWATAGSFSSSGVEGICARKIENCAQCSFYKIVNASLPLYTGLPPADNAEPSPRGDL